jgi:hypothetical protein
MANQLDQAAIQALIAVQAFEQQVNAQLTQQQADLAQAQADLARTQADLLAAQNQVAAIQQQQQQAGVVVEQRVNFAYTPVTTGRPNDLINYEISTGNKIQ